MDDGFAAALERMAAQDGVLHPDQLAAVHVTASRARRRVGSGSWVLGPTGLYEVAGARETFSRRCRRALVAVEHSPRAAGRSQRCGVIAEAAGVLHEMPGIVVPTVIRIGVEHAASHLDLEGVDVQRLRTWGRRTWSVIDGMTVGSVTDTILDVAGGLTEAELLTVVQDAAFAKRTTLDALLGACRRGRVGSAAVRRIVPLLRGGVDSPAHHDFVRTLRRAGFPKPDCGLELVAGVGESDCVLHLPGATAAPRGMTFETDGLSHDAPTQRARDRRKDRRTQDAGYPGRRYSPEEIWRDGGDWVVNDVIRSWELHVGALPREWPIRRPRQRPSW